jgi:hypothetical protein
VSNSNLARCGLSDGQVHELQLLWAAVLLNDDGFGNLCHASDSSVSDESERFNG